MFGLINVLKLQKATKTGDLNKVRELIESGNISANASLGGGANPLYLAIDSNQPEVADYLLSQSRGIIWPAVKRAIEKDNLDVMKYLIENNAIDADFVANDRTPPLLYYTVENGSKKMAEYLVENGADISAEYLRIYWKDRRTMGNCTETALDAAKRLNRGDMVLYLESCLASNSYQATTGNGNTSRKKQSHNNKGKKANHGNAVEKALSKMSAEQLGNKLVCDEKLLQFLLVSGQLMKHLEKFPYKESKSVYTKIRSKVDDKNREAIETMIRNKRQGGK